MVPVDNRFYAVDGALTLAAWADAADARLVTEHRDRLLRPVWGGIRNAGPGDVCFLRVIHAKPRR